MSGVLRITYRKSSIGYSERQKQTVRSLGLRKLGQSVERPDTTTIRGMVSILTRLSRRQPDAFAPIGDGCDDREVHVL